MTVHRRDGSHQSGFLEWVRQVPALDAQEYHLNCADIDIIWHRFRLSSGIRDGLPVHHMMLIEEKSHGADIGMPQREAMWLTHQFITRGRRSRCEILKDVRGREVFVKYWGYFKLRYEGRMPGYGSIWWNQQMISIDQLVSILLFDLEPDTLRRNDPRINHHAMNEKHPELPYQNSRIAA